MRSYTKWCVCITVNCFSEEYVLSVVNTHCYWWPIDSRSQGPIPETIDLLVRQLTISRSDRIPRTILCRSDHDPGDPARYVDRCWIRNFSTTIGHFISNITIFKSTNYRETLTGTWSALCLQFVYFQWRQSHTNICQICMSKPCCIVSKHCACTELATTLSYRHS